MIKESKYKPINLGIFAHVDAGKTTITENFLYKTGVINKVGRVDLGNTQTDSMQIERRRGISIKSATSSFYLDDMKVNLIDTPGHIDFIAEVERVLCVLDCAILVISGKEGVQTQTKVLWSALRKLEIPTIIFINKMDRSGVNFKSVVEEITSELSEDVILMNKCINEGFGHLDIINVKYLSDALNLLIKYDDLLLEKFLNDENVSDDEIELVLKKITLDGKCFPVFSGSALSDKGINELLDGVKKFFLRKREMSYDDLSGVIFKIDRDGLGYKIAYARIFSGVLRNRDKMRIANKDLEVKVKNLKSIVNGKLIKTESIFEGDIAVIYGLDNIEIGDIIGEYSDSIKTYTIPKTTLSSKICPIKNSDLPKLVSVLTELSNQDPLLDFKKNPLNNELSINLVGQIQMEVIKSLLLEKYGISVRLSNIEVIYVEKPVAAAESHIKYKDKHPFAAEIGLKIEPLPTGSGLNYQSNVSYGYILKPFQNAVREAVFETAKEGLFGWEVTDALVSFNKAFYSSVCSTPADFRRLTPLVFMEALDKARTKLLEPRNRFVIRIKESEIGRVLYDLQKMRAVYSHPEIINGEAIIEGLIPIETSYNYRIELASFTKGKGVFETVFDGYHDSKIELTKDKARSKVNPLNRKLYLKSI
ncbi:TetM/TetW/TetO/TetS family tetracycline resistance ribosomal protection protein [Mycoplasmatota bacterium]|nr:TetM/TetW/TetO/TetS family tetracycline resistance ribosomal protection protein [Mycoplasmatota bacterium]